MIELVSKDFKILNHIKKHGPISIENLLLKFSDEKYVTKCRVLNLIESGYVEQIYNKIHSEYHVSGYTREYKDVYVTTELGRITSQNNFIKNKEFFTKQLPLEIMRSILFPAILSFITALITLKWF
ncbi:MAG: hypothetical protein ACRDAS_07975 [Cetobacterium sp.]